MITDYCLGFLFSPNYHRVVLMNKKRPLWQYDLWNGVGGHVEKDEYPDQAMQREFREETSLDVKDWIFNIEMNVYEFVEEKRRQVARVHIFSKRSGAIRTVKTITAEQVKIHKVNDLPENIIPNLNWIIPILTQPLEFPITIKEFGKGGTKI